MFSEVAAVMERLRKACVLDLCSQKISTVPKPKFIKKIKQLGPIKYGYSCT